MIAKDEMTITETLEEKIKVADFMSVMAVFRVQLYPCCFYNLVIQYPLVPSKVIVWDKI